VSPLHLFLKVSTGRLQGSVLAKKSKTYATLDVLEGVLLDSEPARQFKKMKTEAVLDAIEGVLFDGTPARQFTASDVAARIKRPSEPIENAIERVKHWTRIGLLHPVGSQNPGSGRHRSYSTAAVLEAIFLNMLTEAVGMTAVRSRAFRETYDPIILILPTDKTKFIRITFSADKQSATCGTVTLNPNDPKDAVQFVNRLKRPDHDACILIDVAKIHARFKNPQGGLGGEHSQKGLEARRA
jgi:multisubunit Na+/H+ antiporter MnhE subunit